MREADRFNPISGYNRKREVEEYEQFMHEREQQLPLHRLVYRWLRRVLSK